MPFFEKNRAFSSSIWIDRHWGVFSTFITKYLQNINLNEKDFSLLARPVSEIGSGLRFFQTDHYAFWG